MYYVNAKNVNGACVLCVHGKNNNYIILLFLLTGVMKLITSAAVFGALFGSNHFQDDVHVAVVYSGLVLALYGITYGQIFKPYLFLALGWCSGVPINTFDGSALEKNPNTLFDFLK